jgi:uncharacterized protein (TIGR00725 family)
VKKESIFIGVIGGNDIPKKTYLLAEEVGREVAKRGATLICGGMQGVMEAACKGASEAGGLTIGILPGDSRKQANKYVQIPIVRGIGYARNVSVVRSSQAVIAVDGSYGTLTEIGYALQAGIPVIGLGTWSLTNNGKAENNIVPAKNAKDAVAKAMKLIKNNR